MISPWRRRLTWIAALFTLLPLLFWSLDRLYPPDLHRYEATSRLVRDSRGVLLHPFLTGEHTWRLRTRPEEVDANYLAMLIAYEDGRFYHHPGVDPLALVRALWQWARAGRPLSGASTLTMQAARLLSPHPRTLLGKGVEMARALQLEWHYSKEDILSFYLTLAPMGGNLEGVRAASLSYWGREPNLLTPAQAALLVALPQSPTARRPDRHPQAAQAGVNRVLQQLQSKGVLSPQTVAEAQQEGVPRQRLPMPALAHHLAWRLARQAPHGTSITTTLQAPLQQAMERLVRQAASDMEAGATLAVLVVENSRRQVLAYVSGHTLGGQAGYVDLVMAIRSPGSTLKPFLYAMAMEEGMIHGETFLEDRPLRFGSYAPHNFDPGYQGTITAKTALQHSLNLPAIALLDRLGPNRFAALLDQGGAGLVFPRHRPKPGLALALGGVGISLYRLTGLYTALANGGEAKPLRLQVEHRDPSQVAHLTSPAAAWQISRILATAPRPDAFSQQMGGDARSVIAYKTGTSYGFRDAWALGYSTSHTVGVWVGRPDGSTRPGSYGRNTAAPLLFQIVDQLPPAGDLRQLPPPPDTLLAETNQELPISLRHFRPGPAALAAAVPQQGEAPRILFPPDGSQVELAPGEALFLAAQGGTPPLRWLVNGQPLPPGSSQWQPDGKGFSQVVVVDGEGRQDEAEVRLR